MTQFYVRTVIRTTRCPNHLHMDHRVLVCPSVFPLFLQLAEEDLDATYEVLMVRLEEAIRDPRYLAWMRIPEPRSIWE